MKYFLLIFSLLFTFSQSVNAQNKMSDYAYTVVPQQFEFQRGKDQHQVNTLTRHLFREAGFNAIYDVELKGLPRCEGLYADLLMESTFLYTRFTVLIKDCNNVEIYRSEAGSSKHKEYKIAYHEAIRQAFRSIEVLGVNQGDLNAFRESVEKRDAAISNAQIVNVKPESITSQKINSKSLPKYSHNGISYRLETTEDGYILYENRKDDYIKAGNLSKTSREGMYLFTKDGKSMLANFDADNNLIIDEGDSDGAPKQNKYIRVKD